MSDELLTAEKQPSGSNHDTATSWLRFAAYLFCALGLNCIIVAAVSPVETDFGKGGASVLLIFWIVAAALTALGIIFTVLLIRHKKKKQVRAGKGNLVLFVLCGILMIALTPILLSNIKSTQKKAMTRELNNKFSSVVLTESDKCSPESMPEEPRFIFYNEKTKEFSYPDSLFFEDIKEVATKIDEINLIASISFDWEKDSEHIWVNSLTHEKVDDATKRTSTVKLIRADNGTVVDVITTEDHDDTGRDNYSVFDATMAIERYFANYKKGK